MKLTSRLGSLRLNEEVNRSMTGAAAAPDGRLKVGGDVCRSSEISFISFFCPRLWPLSCERPAGGSSYTWTSSPTALPHLRRLPTSSWKPARLLWSSSPNTLALDSRFPQTFQAGTGRILRLCFNRSVWFLRQPVRAMIEYFIFKYKKHLFCKFRESWILSGL